MNNRRIVICLDGTWNNTYTEAERDDGSKVLKPSNVLKLARAVLPYDEETGRHQLVYYHTGVGAMSSYPGISNKMLQFCDKNLGGGWGAGFESNIEDVITFLVHNYHHAATTKDATNPADQIFIYGFSRGASTARAVTQFIDWMGGIPVRQDAYYIPVLLKAYVKSEGRQTVAEVIETIRNNDGNLQPMQEIEITLLGVWDTVMALGSKLFDKARRGFHINAQPPACVKHVYHALAADERRADFLPEIWQSAAPGQTLAQMWFPGVHSNIGGGYVNDGLANGSLRWFAEQSTRLGLKLDDKFLGFYRPYPQDTLYKSKSRFYVIGDWIRAKQGDRELTGYNGTAQIQLHHSIIRRMLSDPNQKNSKNSQPQYPRLDHYRPANVLAFLHQQADPLDYCIQLWQQQKGKTPNTETLDKIKALLEETAQAD